MSFPGMLALIERKKGGKPLDASMIRGWITGVVNGDIPDYQSAALLMAIRLVGMNFDETLCLTRAMADSGSRLTFHGYPILLDKHSTGGVGDKVTLILAPMVAACNVPVTMLSGRGLGFSGGTIDKFEALEGVSCKVSGQVMQQMLDQVGWANAQASSAVAPADRLLYALRDVTGTVDSIPLITASILAKKLSGGATHLCLDVKAGSSAFMQNLETAKQLADHLKRIGEMGGVSIEGYVTRMEEPLGHAVGNYLELMESVAYLREQPDTPLMTLCLALGVRMLRQAGRAKSDEEARAMLSARLTDGSALEKLLAYLRFAGAKEAAVQTLLQKKYEDLACVTVPAPASGFVAEICGRTLGECAVRLGAGRSKADDVVDPEAGFLLAVHRGEEVAQGAPLLRVFGRRAGSMEASTLATLQSAFHLSEAPPSPVEMLLHRF